MFLFVLLFVAVVVLVLVDSVVGTDSAADTDTVPKTSTPLSQRDRYVNAATPKSAIVQQHCKENNISCIDLPCNTVSVDEIIGLPDIGYRAQIEKQKEIVGLLRLTVSRLLDALTESDVNIDEEIKNGENVLKSTLDWLQEWACMENIPSTRMLMTEAATLSMYTDCYNELLKTRAERDALLKKQQEADLWIRE